MEYLKGLRRNGIINIFTSISWNIQSMEIIILTDGGRICRPLYILKDNQLVIKPEHIKSIKNGKLDWNKL